MANVAYDKLDSMVEKIINKIENGETGTWFKPWIGGGLPKNFATKTYYNGFNIISLLITAEEMEFKTNHWLTFNQLKKLGGTLKKGSTATPVFFFKPLEVKEEDENGEEIKKTIPLLKFYNVFNLDQTSLELGDIEVQELPTVQEFVANTGAVIKTRSEAFYSPSEDYIGMPDVSLFKSPDHHAATIGHELIHWTAASHRLDRDLSGHFGSESYSHEELVAELGAVFIGGYLGIETEMRHAEYLESWIINLKADPKLLWKSAAQAQKAFDYLLGLQEQTAAA
jgi:antirestriction protein ArdC